VSQAGITKGDKVKYLAAHSWEKLPRKHGARLEWSDPLGLVAAQQTEEAYEICKRRVITQPKGRTR